MGDKMKTNQTKIIKLNRKYRGSSIIHTTLYDLIKTVIDVADSDENKLINAVTINLLAKTKPCILITSR
jgi:hypothetical protein